MQIYTPLLGKTNGLIKIRKYATHTQRLASYIKFLIMLRNYFIASIRSLRKHFSYSTINIVGIRLGLATCILVNGWIKHELSYDHFHKNASRIYRGSLEYSF